MSNDNSVMPRFVSSADFRQVRIAVALASDVDAHRDELATLQRRRRPETREEAVHRLLLLGLQVERERMALKARRAG